MDSSTLLVPVTQNSDESSTLLVKSPCFCQVVFFWGGGALCAIRYFRGADMLSLQLWFDVEVHTVIDLTDSKDQSDIMHFMYFLA